jgi:hypothetical protein
MVGPRSTVVAVVNFSWRAGGGGAAPTGVVVEEVEGYVWQSAAIGGSGWKRQGRAAKVAAAGGGGNAKMVWCVLVLSRNLVTEILVTLFVWRFV